MKGFLCWKGHFFQVGSGTNAKKNMAKNQKQHIHKHLCVCVCVHYPELWLGGALWTGCVCTEGLCVSEMYSCLWLGWSHGERSLFKTASLARSLSEQRQPPTQTRTFPLSLCLSPAPHTHAHARRRSSVGLTRSCWDRRRRIRSETSGAYSTTAAFL